MPDLIRVKANYQGTVQGVGFRATTSMLAQNSGVTGRVRNLPDGSVELIAEGPPANVDDFLKRIAQQMRHRIDNVETRRSSATGEFDQFKISF